MHCQNSELKILSLLVMPLSVTREMVFNDKGQEKIGCIF